MNSLFALTVYQMSVKHKQEVCLFFFFCYSNGSHSPPLSKLTYLLLVLRGFSLGISNTTRFMNNVNFNLFYFQKCDIWKILELKLIFFG